MIPISERTHQHTLSVLMASMSVAIFSQHHLGFVLDFFMLAWLFWLPYSAYVIFKKPSMRKFQIIRICVWLTAAACIASIHLFWHYTTRRYADEVVSRLNAYSVSHGYYPRSTLEIGISNEELEKKLGISYYMLDNASQPSLIYGVTFEPFSLFSYDFEPRNWEYLPD